MARHQVWDQNGNLIIDEEEEDIITEPSPEERIAALEEALLALLDRGA